MKKKPVLVAIFLAAVVLGFILYTTFAGGNSRYRVEICIAFNGQTECRTARAATRVDALRTATDNVCATLASGQSELERCRNTRPTKENWLSSQ
jgi:hypothetical protein